MNQLKELHDRKLWHQFTVAALQQFQQAAPQEAKQYYDQLVQPNCELLNRSSFVRLSVLVARRSISDPQQALQFMQQVQERIRPDVQMEVDQKQKQIVVDEAQLQAFVLAAMEVARFQLIAQQNSHCLTTIELCERQLNALVGDVDVEVWAAFYRTSADYYKAVADFSRYYKTALLFLACVQLSNLSEPERNERAGDLALAALMGETTYNFGELLMHPVLKSLPQQDIRHQLLLIFNRGDITAFDQVVQQSSGFTKGAGANQLLASSLVYLRQKLCLMSLVEVVFKSGGSQLGLGGKGKVLPFSVIAQETRLPMEDIEHLLMKALSLQLVKGRIDQVRGVLSVEHVQPRVLDPKQLETLKAQIGAWSQRVGELGKQIAVEQQS